MTPFLYRLFAAWRPLRLRGIRFVTPPEPDDQPFTPDEVAALRTAVPSDPDDALDDAPWRDLLLPRYMETFAPGTSIFGRQVLERDLRGGADTAAVAARRARVQALLDDPAQLDRSPLAASGLLGAREYADWFTAADMRHDFRTVAAHGFDAAVQRKAEQVAGWLAQQRRSDAGANLLAP